jgi:hypothetical protein
MGNKFENFLYVLVSLILLAPVFLFLVGSRYRHRCVTHETSAADSRANCTQTNNSENTATANWERDDDDRQDHHASR